MERKSKVCKRGHDCSSPVNLRPNGRCKECWKISNKAYNEKHAEKIKTWFRHRHVLQTYGLSPERYDSMLREQGGCCAICNRKMDTVHVDHDHDSGEVRQLLCAACNKAIGFFQENIPVMESAIAYLRRWKEQ